MSDGRGDAYRLADWMLAQQHPATTRWADRDARLAALAEPIKDDIAMVTDLELATWRRDRFAPDEPATVMLNRWVESATDLQAMLSMRYEGGDPERPFVDASILSRAPASARDLTALADAAIDSYGTLSPHYVRVWDARPVGTFCGTTPDKRFLAAALDELRARILPDGLAAHPTADLRHYDDAVAAYKAVDATHADHPRQAVIETRIALDEARQRGMLFDVRIKGTWSGYVAARPGGRLGLPGYTIQELVLTPTARGHSLGQHLSALLAQALPPAEGVLIGTIHHDNHSALRSALQAGRIDIGGWYGIPLTTPRHRERQVAQLRV